VVVKLRCRRSHLALEGEGEGEGEGGLSLPFLACCAELSSSKGDSSSPFLPLPLSLSLFHPIGTASLTRPASGDRNREKKFKKNDLQQQDHRDKTHRQVTTTSGTNIGLTTALS
jgi:hypothetical protein